MAAETEILAGPAAYEPTRWSIILSAQAPSHPKFLDSWNDLVRLYWRPVYRAMRFSWNEPVEGAKDMTQAFFATLFEREWVRQFAPERGRFRTFLRAALDNFMKNARRDASRLKRGPVPISLDAIAADDTTVAATDDLFEREWRRSLLERAIEDLARSCRPEVVAAFRAYHLDPSRPTYADVARALSINETDVTNHLHAARQELRAIVRRLVRESAETDADADHEMRELFG
jgi:RNA polymerase sigma-70 factor (ECF subfamily)